MGEADKKVAPFAPALVARVQADSLGSATKCTLLCFRSLWDTSTPLSGRTPVLQNEVAMVSAEALSRLLYTLYAAPTSPELWPTFLQEFIGRVGVPGGCIVYHDTNQQQSSLTAYVGLDPTANSLYERYYCKKDEWAIAALQKPTKPGELIYGDELCPRRQLRRTEFYNDFLVRYDTNLFCAIETLKTDTQLESISFFQGVNDQEPDRDQTDLIRLVIPHIQAALRTRRQIAAAETASREFEETLNCLERGVVLLDQSGNCLFVNASAQRILDRRDGISIVKSKLWVHSPVERARLAALTQRSCTSEVINPGDPVAISRHGKRPLNISVHRFCSENPRVSKRAVAIAFISDPEQQVKTPSSLMTSLFGFTQAECRLAGLLVTGYSLKHAAEKCQVTYETVRSQVKSIFNKTGVRRQTELMQLLLKIWHS
jgi:DNA-binding CsgD family transcriptional regulator/PAS domain-containing protein